MLYVVHTYVMHAAVRCTEQQMLCAPAVFPLATIAHDSYKVVWRNILTRLMHIFANEAVLPAK